MLRIRTPLESSMNQILHNFRRCQIADYNISRDAQLVELDGYTVYAINCNEAAPYGEKLREMKPPFAIIWNERKDGIVHVSLRGEGDIDCSKIAQKYNGGGHKYAAGFRLKSISDIPWKKI